MPLELIPRTIKSTLDFSKSLNFSKWEIIVSNRLSFELAPSLDESSDDCVSSAVESSVVSSVVLLLELFVVPVGEDDVFVVFGVGDSSSSFCEQAMINIRERKQKRRQ